MAGKSYYQMTVDEIVSAMTFIMDYKRFEKNRGTVVKTFNSIEYKMSRVLMWKLFSKYEQKEVCKFLNHPDKDVRRFNQNMILEKLGIKWCCKIEWPNDMDADGNYTIRLISKTPNYEVFAQRILDLILNPKDYLPVFTKVENRNSHGVSRFELKLLQKHFEQYFTDDELHLFLDNDILTLYPVRKHLEKIISHDSFRVTLDPNSMFITFYFTIVD